MEPNSLLRMKIVSETKIFEMDKFIVRIEQEQSLSIGKLFFTCKSVPHSLSLPY
jgi:hypothetical protein